MDEELKKMLEEAHRQGANDNDLGKIIDLYESDKLKEKGNSRGALSTSKGQDLALETPNGSLATKKSSGFPEIDSNGILPDFDKMQMPIERLYQAIKREGLYNNTINEFKKDYSNALSRYDLYKALNERGLYSKTIDDFNNQYFYEESLKEKRALLTTSINKKTDLKAQISTLDIIEKNSVFLVIFVFMAAYIAIDLYKRTTKNNFNTLKRIKFSLAKTNIPPLVKRKIYFVIFCCLIFANVVFVKSKKYEYTPGWDHLEITQYEYESFLENNSANQKVKFLGEVKTKYIFDLPSETIYGIYFVY